MKIDISNPYGINCHVVEQWSPVLGGWSCCQPDFLPSLGNTGFTPLACSVGHVWKNSSGNPILANWSDVNLYEQNGYCQGSNSIVNAKPSPEQGVCTLWFVVWFQIKDDNNNYYAMTFDFNTGWQNVSAPDQVTANYPDILPANAGIGQQVYCSFDVNGTNTRYEAEANNASITPNGNNGFTIVPNASTASWRARAINDQGIGAWSSWCSFAVIEALAGNLSVSLDPQDGKPIHSIDGSFSCSSGHTITSYSWQIYKQINGNWMLVDSSISSNYAGTFTDNPAGINYKVVLSVQGTKNGNTSSATFEEYCSYGN